MRIYGNKKRTIGPTPTQGTFSAIIPALSVAGFLVCVFVPDNVVRETIHLVACTFGHLGEAFSLGLVFEGVGREVDACRLDVRMR